MSSSRLKAESHGTLPGGSGIKKAPKKIALQRAPLIIIGSSTGGPAALRALLAALPAKFWGSIVIVQHIHGQFLPGFMDWLRQSTGKQVLEAMPGSEPAVGKVQVAGSHGNLRLTAAGTFEYGPCDRTQLYCPSIDMLFESIAASGVTPGIACVLTGMGDDGARGLSALAKLGWRTIVQSPDSCVVDGMPTAALRLHPRHEIKQLANMAEEIRRATLDFCGSTYGKR